MVAAETPCTGSATAISHIHASRNPRLMAKSLDDPGDSAVTQGHTDVTGAAPLGYAAAALRRPRHLELNQKPSSAIAPTINCAYRVSSVG